MLGALVADGAAASLADRGHSFASLSLPPAAVGSLPILNSQLPCLRPSYHRANNKPSHFFPTFIWAKK